MTMTLASIAALPIIGEGNFRRVHRDGDYVYKVEYGVGVDLAANFCENRNIALLDGRLPEGMAIPETSLLCVQGEGVIRMAYVEGVLMGDCNCIPGEAHDETCLPGEVTQSLLDLGIDPSYGNVILSGGTYFIVDLDADLE